MLGRKLSSNPTLIAAVLAVALIGGCDRATTAPSSSEGNFFAAHLVVQNGNNQSGPSMVALPLPVSVKVTDAGGVAVSGAVISFTVRQGGGTVSAVNSVSDASGIATSVWTLGASLGAQQLVALLNQGADSAVFTAVATSGSPAQILLISGNGQVGRSDQVLASPLVVEVTDAAGKPLAGASVKFTQGAANPDGFTSANPATTGADGIASVTWTLDKNTSNTTVPMSVAASVAGVPAAVVTFTATSRPEYRIQRVTTPFLQVDTTGATIGAPGDYLAGVRDTLRVQVYDPSDTTGSSGVQGVSVTWATQVQTGTTDGHPNNATTVTDNFGFAKTTWVLRSDAGAPIPPSNVAKRMFATATFATATIGQVEFQAKVTPGRICSVNQDPIAGSPTVGASVNVTATVKDCNGFPVSGDSVTFTPTAGSVSPGVVISNLSGQVSTTWTLPVTVGPQKLFATASGQADPSPSVQSVTVTPLPPASVIATSSPPAHDAVGFPQSVTFQVKDTGGNAMVGQLVTFTVTGGLGSAAPGSATTDASGNVTVLWTLGPAAGVNTLTATVGSITSSPVTITTP